ncbi:hypothetical protein [Sinobaca sp. H24]
MIITLVVGSLFTGAAAFF